MSMASWKYGDDICRCCHNKLLKGNFVSLSDACNFFYDKYKTYGDILLETFDIHLLPSQSDLNAITYKICEECKRKVEDGALFKKQVLSCEKKYSDLFCKHRKLTEDEAEVWDESNANNVILIKVEKLDKTEENEHEDTSQIIKGVKENIEVEEQSIDYDMKHEEVFEEIEYLEDDVSEITPSMDNNNVVKGTKFTVQSGPSRYKTKKDKRKKYFQYTEEDLRKAMDAVRDNRMTRLEASEFYHVPRKTIVLHLQAEIERPEVKINRDLTFKFINEIKTILTFTNATPFKTRINEYLCAYCTEFKSIDFADIRSHTRSAHTDDRTKKVDIMMRPHSTNEIIRFDIENLLCVVCCVLIEDWNTMFRHLEGHDIQFDQAFKRVVPYTLSMDFECALCHEEFYSFKLLDSHMNQHYSNYVCGECGQTFLTQFRLTKHTEFHKKKSNRSSNESLKAKLKFKCKYCSERFPSEGEMKKHILELHEEELSLFACQWCDKTFIWQRSYNNHVRSIHKNKYQCIRCGKKFFKQYDLKEHEESNDC